MGADFPSNCEHCLADCLLYWRYFKMYVALMYGSRLCKNSALSFRFSGQTNKPPLSWRDAYLCLSLHTVFLEITCCFRDQTLFISLYYFARAFRPVLCVYEITWSCNHFCQRNLQLRTTFYHPQVISPWVRRSIPGQYTISVCIYIAFHEWEKWAKTRFCITLP